ncbi:MAG: acyltransferase [Lachnospiraceae bacterium]|nr:acyltransferase [Lachnospiraceae bacterium]
MIILLQIFPIGLLVLTFWGAKVHRNDFNDDFLELTESKKIQAVACLGVILHHLTQQITGYGVVPKGLVTIFNYAGILFTSLFFFYSGFGLVTSIRNKPGYLNTFVTKRFPTILIPFWIINAIYVLYRTAVYGAYDLMPMLSRIFGIILINGNGWFIIEIAVLYVIFYFIFMLIKNEDIAIALLSVGAILIIIYAFMRGHDIGEDYHWFRGEWWYNSTIVFVFGLVYARWRSRIEAFCKKHYKAALITVSILFVIAFLVSIHTVNRYGYYNSLTNAARDALITLITQSVACLLFTMLVLLISMKILVKNRALTFVSGISMELFLIHGLFLHNIFEYRVMKDPVRFAVVISCSVVAAALIKPVCSKAVSVVIKVLNRKKQLNDTLEGAIIARKREKMRKIAFICILTGAIVLVVTVFYLTTRRYLFAGAEFREESAMISEAQVGDTVLYGHFDTNDKKLGQERLEWIVLDKDSEKACLITKYAIAGGPYNRAHRKITWEESDMCEMLNSEEYLDMFSEQELFMIIPVGDDALTLLTAEEAEKYFDSDDARRVHITEAAQTGNTNINEITRLNGWVEREDNYSWWWLRGTNTSGSITAPIVDSDGSIKPDKMEVNKARGAVRPVVWVEIMN